MLRFGNMDTFFKPCLTCLLLIAAFNLNAQKVKTQNYKKFDQKLFHFGAVLGGNTADFSIFPVTNAYEKYGITAIENQSQPGGQIGILSSMKLGTPLLRLRFVPSLSFQERVIRYYSLPTDPEKTTDDMREERVNSTNLDFPLLLQFRTARYNNFASYFIGGMEYAFDLQSSEDANQNFADPFIKIAKKDWQGQVGMGVEFFAVYFKLGLELKFSYGFNNVLIQDNTDASKPLDQLRNKVWVFSVIFEG